MSHVSCEDLRKEIKEILKDADLTKLSAKKVRQKLQIKFKCDLTARKEEIDKMVLQIINGNDDSKEEDDDDNSNASDGEESTNEEDNSDSEDNQKKVPPKRNTSTVKKATKRKANESGSDENESEEEYSPRSKRAATAAANSRAKKTTKATGKKAGGKGKETGFTRAYTLSPDLAALMGAESLPRHEVVKKMWAMIKERNLYDPKNKQYAICDSDLLKVIGVKRFRTFGMLKYLRPHFLD